TQAPALELADPAFGDRVDRHRVDEVQLLPTLTLEGHEVCLLENRQMLGHSLTRHLQPLAQLAQRLAILPVQPVQQLPAARIGQGPKYSVVIHVYNMEPFGYLL